MSESIIEAVSVEHNDTDNTKLCDRVASPNSFGDGFVQDKKRTPAAKKTFFAKQTHFAVTDWAALCYGKYGLPDKGDNGCEVRVAYYRHTEWAKIPPDCYLTVKPYIIGLT